jgi:MFS transporter, FHS family, glucose/mannose:H+ symporter
MADFHQTPLTIKKLVILVASLATTSMTKNSRALTMWAAVAFVPIGVITVLLGPILPALSAKWSLNYAQAGSLFTVQFAASTLGSLFSGLVGGRRRYRAAIALGLAGITFGLLALTAHSWQIGVFGIVLYGWGLGLAIPAANLLVAEANPENRSASLNRLNFAWSAGAVLCPFLIAPAVKADRLSTLICGLAASVLIVAAGILLEGSWRTEEFHSSLSARKRWSIQWNHPGLVTFLLLFFLYVGTENAIGGWAASYAKDIRGSLSTLAITTPSLYYGALALGRWLAPFGLRKISEITLARCGLVAACTGMATLVLVGTMTSMLLALSLIGLGLSAVYPITISLLSQRFGREAAPRVGALMFTVANFGGASLPWLVGLTSVLAKSLRIGLLAPLAAGMLMLAIYPKNSVQGK